MGERMLRARDTFWLTALAAVIAATAHVGWVFVRVHVLHRLVGTSRELPWFSPLSYFGCFLVVALPVAIAARWIPTLATPRVQGTLLGTAAAIAVVLHASSLHPLAGVLLAVGVGVQGGRFVSRDASANLRLTRRATIALAALLLAAGVPEIVLYRVQQRSELASLPAAAADAPNVILLILDTVRAANVSAYGYNRLTTPTLDRLAAEGVLFEAAIAPAPWTAPSHATLLTGRYPYHAGISYLAPMADSLTTVTEAFRANGYATGAFMGNAYYAGRRTGFDRAFVRYDDYPVSLRQAVLSATIPQLDVVTRVVAAMPSRQLRRVLNAVRGAEFRLVGENRGDRYTAEDIVSNFSEWRDGIGTHPYFALLNFFDAHAPYETPQQTRFNKGQKSVDRYDGAIHYEDTMLERLVEDLRRRGELDRTVIVVTADHGEQFGEHGLNQHGNSLYLELLHVPLVVRAPPRVPAGRRVDSVVSLRDVPSTLLELAGLRGAKLPGTSLSTYWSVAPSVMSSPALAEAEQPENQVNRWPTSYGPMKALVTNEYHYIRRGDGEERVYAWRGDTAGRGELTATDRGARARLESHDTFSHALGRQWTLRKAP